MDKLKKHGDELDFFALNNSADEWRMAVGKDCQSLSTDL
jgi:hypothetical protein